MSVTAVVRGRAWAVPDEGAPFEVGPGDVLVSVGTQHWTIADSQSSPVNIVIHPGQHCTTPDGRPLAEEMHQGVRQRGNSASGASVMLTGAYGMEGEVSRRLLRALPRFVVLTEGQARLAVDPPARGRDRQGLARPGRRARPASGPAPDRGAARVVRAAGIRSTRVVPRPVRPHRRSRPPATPAQPGAPLDGRRAGRCGRGLAGGVRSPLHRRGRRATDDVPHRLATGAGRRPAGSSPAQRSRR